MAYSTSSASAEETENYTADAPCLMGQNLLDGWVQARWTAAGNNGDTDDTATNYPVAAARDRSVSVKTARATSATTHYFNVQLPTGFEFNTVVVLGHNFNQSGGQVQIQIADDANFSVNPLTVGTLSGGDITGRISRRTLTRYVDVEYFRLRITASGAFTPEFRDLWVGTRRQLPHKMLRPYNAVDNFDSDVARLEFGSGAIRKFTKYAGRRIISGKIPIYTATHRTTVDDIVTDTDHLSKNFLWFENVNTDGQDVLLVDGAGEVDRPYEGPNLQHLSLSMREVGPEAYFRSQEV